MWIIYAENFLNLLIFKLGKKKFRRSLGLGISFYSVYFSTLGLGPIPFYSHLGEAQGSPGSSFVDHYTTRCDRLVTET